MKAIYKKCKSCGKYFLDSSENNNYCSNECNELYIRCTVCGNYFLVKKEITSIENYICSDECAKRFIIKKNKKNQKLDFSNL